MPRPQRCRRVCREPDYDIFRPGGIAGGSAVTLTVDEYEVLRLVDHEKKTHQQCAVLMDISRSTVTEIYESVRYKIADSIVNGKALVISGGNYRLCGGDVPGHCGKCCRSGKTEMILSDKGENTMRIAVTYENGQIFQHFGHTEQFKVYDIENGQIVSQQVVGSDGQGHSALASLLSDNKIDALICGGIGGGAQMALASAGIKLYGGVTGSADDAVNALLNGTLGYDPDAVCDHHGHGEHSCGEHDCGEHDCGHGCH